MSIVITDVVTQFGAFYKPGSDNQKNLRSVLYKPSETAKYFQLRPTVDTIWRGTLASLNRVLQPFQKAFTPISTITFTPNQFNLFELKIDLQETPDDLEASYLGFLTDMDSAERAQWPFVRWWLEQHVVPRAQEDKEVNEIFTGVFAAPAPGVAGAAGTAMNGIRKVIRIYNAAGLTNLGNGAIATGLPDAVNATFVGQVETFVEGIPSLFRAKIKYVFMSKANLLKYRKGKRDKYGKEINYMVGGAPTDLVTIEDHPSIQVIGLESMTGSNMIWTSIPENMIAPTKKASLENSMVVKEFSPRTVSAYTDWWEACNFEVPQFVFHNDQDLV